MKTPIVTPAAGAAYHSGVDDVETRAYAKVTRRLVPFLMLCYLGAYLDRVNVGFAKLQMLSDLQWSDTVYGLGAGVFFIGYFLFEVPSNMILHRFGARRWLARIMITWAMISASFAFVSSPTMFYVLRFLLGVAEAGFAPGVILYITYWFPSARRAKVMGLFFMAIPLASIVGAPLSGWIMEAFAGVQGLRGWQWLFALEAIPSLILGVTILFYLDDSIAGAKWLSPEEKAVLQRNIATENDGKVAHQTIRDFLADRRLWLLTGIYFCIVMGQYGLTFWLPTIVRNAGATGLWEVGMLAAIPYGVALVCLPLVGRNSDRTRARRLHCGVPMLAAAAALFALPFTDGIGTALALLSVAAAGALCGTSQFWALPTAFLGGMTAAAGIATINCIANLAGFFSPSLVGWLNDFTGKQGAGLMLTSGMLLLGACLVVLLPKQAVDR
ncbi:MFS transporter [Pseudoduganella albidiflava]|uniref:MFS transporter n=1 Tax=Pseudoduganella albidiflava TaxID=321983 RepID=A0A411WX43_9BURK|nr:MFS transporter [Pseudoduganella albidiflava]QBI01373.1 MFS transporter [Pseudoduganella albidiflava]GGY36168.1 MFS transporter [Pseudoduganella albidiflava]